jgi:23S rRNA (cytidine1920-2'-O)/16S rRNA (cytidine1409-2'-O)-methyltransferase
MRRLEDVLRRSYPALEDPAGAIREGRVLVDGSVVTNPASMVRRTASVALRRSAELRGETKLRAALWALHVAPRGLVSLDAGSATGGFVKALLDAGAQRVYAVDVGHGQLLGSLRQDDRVVNLEATNIAGLDARLVPDSVDLVTLDLSYLSLTAAVPYLDRLSLSPGAQLLALVKPMFELRLSRPPDDEPRLEQALRLAEAGITAAGWSVVGSIRSPVLGARGAVEFFVHARRT